MARFSRDGDTVTLYLPHHDIDLLTSLSSQLIELLSEGHTEQVVDDDDPLARLAAELAEAPAEEPTDPALRRLFPNPYAHDPQAAADFRRHAEGDHRRRKIADAYTVQASLAQRPVRIPPAEVGAWLKTLNALRLVLAARLGLEDDESVEELRTLPTDDPRVMMGVVMDWLAYLQANIIDVVEPGLDG